MKLKTLGFLTTASVMLIGTNANANLLFDIYAGGTVGVGGYTMYADGEHTSQSAMAYGGVIGIDLPLFRIEGEYNYIDGDDATLNLGMANAYFKIPTPVVKPYIGAGIGTTFDSKYEPKNAPKIDIDDTVAYQGMLGLTLDLPVLPIKIDVEGRVLYANNIFEIANEKTDLLQYDGRVKLRYIF